MSAKVVKKEYVLEGLDCANCALKIEKGVGAIEGIESCSVNFVNKTLTIQAEQEKALELEAYTKDVVRKLEPDVVVIEKGMAREEQKETFFTSKNIKIVIGAAIFGLAFFLNGSLELPAFLIAYALVGGDVVMKSIRNISRGQVFDENFLMTIATVGAFIIGEYPEAVAVMLFYQVGEAFQGYAVNRSRQSITALMDIRPEYANVKKNGAVVMMKPEEVNIGDIIVVKPGERIPLDGIVMEGSSAVDTSALTGESIPRDVEVNSEVLSGFINVNGLITVNVTKKYSESTVAKILDLVENASSKKAPTENFITKFARYYTPAVVGVATFIAIVPPLVTGDVFSEWVYRALVFLVISCPCALVVSIPLGFFGGIGTASRHGILVKGGNYLEALNNVETVVFDKTGTLTKGIFTVKEVITNDVTKEEVLRYGALAETNSNHPIALSIVKYYGENIPEGTITAHEEIAGHGLIVYANGEKIVAGNSKLMVRENIPFTHVPAAGTVVYVAVDGVYKGAILIGDEVKEDSKEAIRGLKQLGVGKTVMLTGDSAVVAKEVAAHLGIDEVYSELLPHQKVEKFEAIHKSNGKIIFVGDGMNDTPVLAQADIGIAMGGLGSHAAIEAADVVIMNDEPSKIVTAIKIAKITRRIVWQNIFFAFAVKLIVLSFGAFGIATMWEAVFADVGVTLLAVLNATRVLRMKVM